MNIGTIIRSLLVLATCVNTALMATDVTQFESAALNLVYQIASVVSNFVIVACATYFNNDYTETACKHTGKMRQEKAEKKAGYIGEVFHDDDDAEFFESETGDADNE